MAEHEAKGAEFEKAAQKKMRGWAFWGYKYDDAADLFEKAANSYKLGKFYALRCLILAVNHFMEIGRLSTAAKYNKEIGEIYENEQDFEKAMEFFERAADLYQGEEVNSTANQCRLKVAQFASQLELYPKAIEIFESVAKESINNSLLKYSVKGYLLNAGLCQICRGDTMTLNNALEKYQELDPTFSGTRECKFLADLVVSIDEEDVEKFTDVVKEFDSMNRLDQWKTTLLLRAKNSLKARELEEDDLT